MKRFLIVVSVALAASSSDMARAQQLPTLSAPLKGDTVNMNISNGTKSSLNFGSSTVFGVSSNMNAAEGSSGSASSQLAPLKGTLNFSIGTGATQGTTSANIKNLRAIGGGDSSVGGAPIKINGENGNFSSGDAQLTGVQGKLDLELDPTKTNFNSRTNTLHTTYGTIPGQDSAQIGKGSQNSTATGSASVNTNTNVDINTSSFQSVFMQAF